MKSNVSAPKHICLAPCFIHNFTLCVQALPICLNQQTKPNHDEEIDKLINKYCYSHFLHLFRRTEKNI